MTAAGTRDIRSTARRVAHEAPAGGAQDHDPGGDIMSAPAVGTLHSLADHRASRGPEARFHGEDLAEAPDPDEAAHWKLLAERAAHVLSALEAAAAAGTRRPGLASLTAEAAGLRAALEDAANRQFLTTEILDFAYARGLADRRPRKHWAPEDGTPEGAS